MRKPGWEVDLSTWVEQIQRRKFEWGKLDCALMAAECIEVIAGTHPHPELIGSYHSPIGAMRVIHAHGSLTEILDRILKRVEVDHARKGDIILCQFGRKETLGICYGARIIIMGQECPVMVGTGEVKKLKAWRNE